MKERKFKMSYWLHSHSETGEFLQFDLFELEGTIHSEMIDFIIDTELMNIDIVNADLSGKDMLEKVLESDCIFHFANNEYQEDHWIEFIDTKVIEG